MAGAEPDVYLDLANELLAAAAQCLEDHTEAGMPEELILGWGDVPHWCCDFLMVYSPSMTPTNRFPGGQSGPVVPCEEQTWGLELNLKLRRCGYPKLEQNPDSPFPSGESLTLASQPLYRDARVLHCCIVALWRQGELFRNPNIPAAAGDVAQLPVQWGSTVPYREADCAGLDWPITVGVDPCCVLPPVASGS